MGRIGLNGAHPTGLLRERCDVLPSVRTSDGAGGFEVDRPASQIIRSVRCASIGLRVPASVVVLGQTRHQRFRQFWLDRRMVPAFESTWRLRDCDGVEWEVLQITDLRNVLLVECQDVVETSGDCGV